MALNANALATLDRTKLELDIQLADTDFDTQIEQYINIASDEIELLCNRVFRQQVYTHRLSGNGTNWVIFEQFPVTTLTTVEVDKNWVFGAGTDIPVGTEADVDKELFLVRRGPCNNWPAHEPMNIKTTYTAGYGDGSDPSTLPNGIQGACIEYVRFLYLSQGDRRIGRTTKNKLGESASWEANNLPFVIEALYKPYIRDNAIDRARQLLGLPIGLVSSHGGDKDNK